MGSVKRFQMADDLARLHDELDSLRWARGRDKMKKVEGHYTDRLIRGLEAQGLGPIKSNGANDSTDLSIAGVAVEVKIARGRARNRNDGAPARTEYYQALLWEPATERRRKRRVLNGEIVILVCVDREDRLWPFVIPRSEIGKRRTVEITSRPDRYRGRWAPFLGAFDYLKRGGSDV